MLFRSVFSVSAGGIPGSVDLRAESVVRGSHEWQYSADAANANGWIEIDPTVQASASISGLGTLKRYFFRHRTVTVEGPTEWDEPISILVV